MQALLILLWIGTIVVSLQGAVAVLKKTNLI